MKQDVLSFQKSVMPCVEFNLSDAQKEELHLEKEGKTKQALSIQGGVNDPQNPDFVKYAESMHAKGYRVEKAEELLPILKDAFQQKVPCIIDCPVDYSENTKLSEYLQGKFASEE